MGLGSGWEIKLKKLLDISTGYGMMESTSRHTSHGHMDRVNMGPSGTKRETNEFFDNQIKSHCGYYTRNAGGNHRPHMVIKCWWVHGVAREKE